MKSWCQRRSRPAGTLIVATLLSLASVHAQPVAGVWYDRTDRPEPRMGPAMAYDAARGRVVLFGGSGASGPLGDTWEWDGTSWSQVPSSGPSVRSGHAMAYDTVRGHVVLFGGTLGHSGVYFGDTWQWNGTS